MCGKTRYEISYTDTASGIKNAFVYAHVHRHQAEYQKIKMETATKVISHFHQIFHIFALWFAMSPYNLLPNLRL